MCIYCNTINYRKIYQTHFGSIPFDEDGRTFDIHHKDGNKKNNIPSNLMCVSIDQHYDIHNARGDYGECLAISMRMKITPEQKSAIAKKAVRKQLDTGIHNFFAYESF